MEKVTSIQIVDEAINLLENGQKLEIAAERIAELAQWSEPDDDSAIRLIVIGGKHWQAYLTQLAPSRGGLITESELMVHRCLVAATDLIDRGEIGEDLRESPRDLHRRLTH